ncbi:MAG TPA: hypothetical protein VHM25_28750 [Polyangiaceae bacterium]|nr:hypothetical protein [Polyangiaceae bacterium]
MESFRDRSPRRAYWQSSYCNLQVGGATLDQVNYTIVGPNEYVKCSSE